ncbi:MAG: conjugal transfer protein TraI [Sphingobacteriales bacterium]|nr:conjugal transfer protein TraI [Sphingobacteriales bacterium]OJW01996.1 MAG: conjugal transfer protein TraI [Sphingobacteriales bacterium 44-61]
MKRIGLVLLITAMGVLLPVSKTEAQALEIIEVIKAGVKKVIKAVDLKIQRLQNETIWLQNAQKAIENTMSKLRLDEISDWVEKHREQYAVYFDELRKVKLAISGYQKVREVMDKQVRIVEEYKRAFALFKQDQHFTSGEVDYMLKVYSGIIEESLKNLDQLFLVIDAFKTEMTDGRRLEIISEAAVAMDENLNDLHAFNTENILLSVQRSRDEVEVARVKALYGIE